MNWPAVGELFAAALETPPEQREALLSARTTDPAVRAEVLRLLSRHEALDAGGARVRFLEGLDLTRAAALVDQAESSDPARVGRYDVIARLGEGATGVVYHARDPALGRDVVIKLLSHALSRDATALRRFAEEARVVSALDHPRIVTVYDIGRADGEQVFLVMAYHEGETLRQRLERAPLPVTEAVRIAAEIADGLEAVHNRGIVHRDIKPENVLITDRGACILDFGIATIAGGASTRRGAALGTVAYMSPEQTTGGPLDRGSDLWSLGVVLYEMLAGRLPFGGTRPEAILDAIRHQAPTPLAGLRPDVPPAVAAVVDRCLEKHPTRRYPSAKAVGLALEAQARGRSVPRIARRLVLTLGGLAALAGAGLLIRSASHHPLDPDLLVVAPFDVLDPDLGIWREGFVDLLSASLDGAGPLRTAPPSAAIKRWSGPADRASASRLADGLRAGLAIYGRLVRAGEDSVRVAAALLDVGRGRVLADLELRGNPLRIDQLADSLAMRVLAVLSGTGLSAERLSSLGSRSPAAVKAFLQGEQYLRRMSLDSAARSYGRAIEQDSSFALALNHMGLTLGWQGRDGASLFLRAGARNRGLALRESLLVASDSLQAVLGSIFSFTGDPALVHRLFSTLEQATARYPEDVGAWYRLGEARAHWGTFTGARDSETLLAFERAVQLDSSFAPAHLHLVQLTLAVHGAEAGRRLITRLVDKDPTGRYAGAFRLTASLLDPRTLGSAETQALLDTLPAGTLADAALLLLSYVPDSAESMVRAARAHARYQSADWYGPLNLAYALSLRGHGREASSTIDIHALRPDARPASGLRIFSELALLGIVPKDTAAAVFATWLRDLEDGGTVPRMPAAYMALAWWCAAGDTAALTRAAMAADAWGRRRDAPALVTAPLRYTAAAARAYLALARGDSAEALRRFTAIPAWPCPLCARERLATARLLAAAARDREAAVILEADPLVVRPLSPSDVLWMLERGRVHERLGDRDQAVAAYSYVAAVWLGADPALQPIVQEARAALARLLPRVSRR